MVILLASLQPFAFSMLNDVFPAEIRGRAFSAYMFGLYLGTGLSSISLTICTHIGWKWCFRLVGFISFALTFLLLLIQEPKRIKT